LESADFRQRGERRQFAAHFRASAGRWWQGITVLPALPPRRECLPGRGIQVSRRAILSFWGRRWWNPRGRTNCDGPQWALCDTISMAATLLEFFIF
jgi:hypothetical protein